MRDYKPKLTTELLNSTRTVLFEKGVDAAMGHVIGKSGKAVGDDEVSRHEVMVLSIILLKAGSDMAATCMDHKQFQSFMATAEEAFLEANGLGVGVEEEDEPKEWKPFLQ